MNKGVSFYLVLLLLSLAGGGLLVYATRGGLGAESDTASYLSAARNLIHGEGFGIYYPSGRFVFLSYWAPLLSLLLAGLDLLFQDPLVPLRWINLLFYIALGWMSGAYCFHVTRSKLLSCGLTLLIGLSPLFLGTYVTAMSEPMFFFFALAGVYGVLLYLENSRPAFFYLAAGATALALLTRYAAFPVLVSLCLLLFLAAGPSWLQRIRKTLVFLGISLSGLAIWLPLVWVNTGTLGGRQVLLSIQARQQFNVIKAWFVERFAAWVPGQRSFQWMVDPHSYQVFWLVAIMLFLVALAWLAVHAWRGRTSTNATGALIRLAFMCLAFIFFYSIFLVISYVFMAPFALVDRVFAPIEYFALVLVFAGMGLGMTRIKPTVLMNAALSVGLLLWCGSTTISGFTKGLSYPSNGIGYNTREARASPLLAALRVLPDTIGLVSNEGPYLLYHVNRFPFQIAELNRETPDWDFSAFGSDLSDPAQQAFAAGQAALVIFPTLESDFSNLYGARAGERLQVFIKGLYVVYRGPDGMILFMREPDLHE